MPKALRGQVLARYETRARVMKALAHPTRLFLVDALADGERCVRDLTSLVGADVSTIAKHLALLKHVGIVADRKRGAQVFYSLRTPCVRQWPACVEGVLAADARRVAAAAR